MAFFTQSQPVAPSGAGSRLRIDAINKHFGAFQALRDVHLDIQPGELVCFLGPSGCGKTTLLRIIAGLESACSGSLMQGERDITHCAPRDRDFGIVFQSYALFPNLSVADNIAFGLRSQGMPRAAIRARVDELLTLIGLHEHARKYPAQLSGGQQQRVALARALAPSPGLLLLDEPLSALDARVRMHLRREIRSLQQRLGVTTILVTHDQEEALSMADRIVVMNQGVIEQIGTPLEIYQQPRTAFVADFIGAMNFVESDRISATEVRLGQRVLRLTRAADGAGARVRLAIRPEDAQLVPAGQGDVAVRVDQLDYLGAFVRCRVHAEPLGQTLLVDVDPRSARALGLTEGQQLDLCLPADAMHCFAA